jgi:hypothetical protein
MTPDEIIEKATSLLKVAKDRDKKYPTTKELPEFYPGYDKLLRDYQDARVHADAEFPVRLFNAASPMMSTDEQHYVKESYQAETQDCYIKFSNTLKRALANGELSVKPKTGNTANADELRKYIDEEIDGHDSLYNFMNALSDHKVLDGMGVFGVWPEELPTEVNNEGDLVVTGRPSPQPKLYPIDKVWYADSENFLCVSSEKSKVKYQGKLHKIGVVLHFYGPEYLMKLVQVGEDKDNRFEVSMIYDHMVGFTPANYLMGVAKYYRDRLVYIAPFNYAVKYLNLAALDSSNLLTIKRKVGYPTRVVMREKCQFQENGSTCENGQITWATGEEWKSKTCSNCKGTGYVGIFGPLSELSINATPSGLDQGNSISAGNAMAYVSPSTDIPRLYADEIKRRLEQAESALYLKAEPRTGGDITATEKTINAKNTESFIKPFSDQLWHIYQYIAESIGRMMFTDSVYEETIEVIAYPPKSFDLIKPEDYIEAIAKAVESKVPSIIIQELMYQYMMASANESETDVDIFEIISDADRLVAEPTTEIILGLSRGTVQPWEYVLHQSAQHIVYTLIREDARFLKKTRSEQIALIQAKAKTLIPAPEFALPAPEL